MVSRAAKMTSVDAVLHGLQGAKKDTKGKVLEFALLGALMVILATLFALLFDVMRLGVGVLVDRPGAFFTGKLSTFSAQTAGISQGIKGSMLLMIFVVIVAFPLGIASAVYLEEYASDTRLNRFISVNIRNLAGVPAIVYGLLGLTIFVQFFGGLTGGTSLIAGGLTLAVLVLPIVIITSSEALRAVPDSIREAGYGVGATRWQVIRSHVLPSAAPGILTGTVLSISRAVGETAPLLVVGAITGFLSNGGQNFVEQLRGKYTSMPTIIYRWATLPNQDFRALTSAAIIVLLAVTLLANGVAIFLRNRYERKW
ncbi:MAG: phosphate transport system permease protein [Actinomycetota bacterium]|jgi:phosphate transport system permease protein|nr:phosphate transport system permease protein [Actinomycetota bacterium]